MIKNNKPPININVAAPFGNLIVICNVMDTMFLVLKKGVSPL